MRNLTLNHNSKPEISKLGKHRLNINYTGSIPKYKQIVNSIANDIELGFYKKDDQLLSITELSIEYLLSRDTVEKAYKELKQKGYINAIQGKGYFVKYSETEQKKKVLFVMNKISTYKKTIFHSFVENLGSEYKVDLRVHNYNFETFEDIVKSSIGKYNYYVIMPHFDSNEIEHRYLELINLIPNSELIILDKYQSDFKGINIYQDFENDIYEIFEKNLEKFKKYQKLGFVFPKYANYPLEIVKGFKNFAILNNIDFEIYNNAVDACEKFKPNQAFVVVEESDLSEMIKYSRKNSFQLGKQMGLIAFNETTLKELLDISVITTDFEFMGSQAAKMLKENSIGNTRNPFFWIERSSI